MADMVTRQISGRRRIGRSIECYYSSLPPNCDERKAMDLIGGPDNWNAQKFRDAYINVLKQQDALPHLQTSQTASVLAEEDAPALPIRMMK
jgi:hypothetical protein